MNLEESDDDYRPEKDVTPVRFEAEPFVGFDTVDTFETIACDSTVLRALRNEVLDEEEVKSSSKFRIDYTETPRQYITCDQRQITAIALRMLCRGAITRNSVSVENAIERLFPGKVEYSNNDFAEIRYLIHLAPAYPFDSDREKRFAEILLKSVIGENWPLYVNSQVLIQTIAPNAPTDASFAGQRTDFFVSMELKISLLR